MVFLVQVLVGTGVGNILKSSLISNKKVGIILIYLLFSLGKKMDILCFNYQKIRKLG